MNYTIDQLNRFMDRIQAEEKEIRIDRGKRYGSPDDTLANVREFGADGCIVSMWECMMRIRRNFGKPKDVADSKNSAQDLRNFAGYYIKFVEEEDSPVTICACDLNQTYDPPVDMPPAYVVDCETGEKRLLEPQPKVVPWESPDVATCDEEWKRQPTKEIQ